VASEARSSPILAVIFAFLALLRSDTSRALGVVGIGDCGVVGRVCKVARLVEVVFGW
jgi:hypothetical protein